MKKLFLLSGLIVLLGAGCFGGGDSQVVADGGVFKSIDLGEEWTQQVVVPTERGIGTLAGANVMHLKMDPQDSKFLYIGTRKNGMLYSDNGAASWSQPREKELQEGLITDIAVDHKNVCTVYVAKGQKLFKTIDCMRTFDDELYVETRAGVEVIQVEVDWYSRNVLWVGLSNGDLLKSIDSGKTWQTILSTGDEISDILVNKKDSRIVLVGTFASGYFKTVDGGENWTSNDEGLAGLSGSRKVYTLTQSKDSDVVLSATRYGILKSMDFGHTWEPLDLVTSPQEVLIRALVMDPSDPNKIYYASQSTFYSTVDGGATWKTDRLPSTRLPQVMLIDPDDSSVLYIGVMTPAR